MQELKKNIHRSIQPLRMKMQDEVLIVPFHTIQPSTEMDISRNKMIYCLTTIRELWELVHGRAISGIKRRINFCEMSLFYG